MRRLILICALLFAFPAAADLSFLGLKNSLVDFALEQISVPGELELKAEGVEDSEDGATDIVGLTVADGDGVWMKVERLSLRWNPARVLRGELEIARLAASGVQVARPPAPSAVAVEVKDDSALAEGSGGLFDWPRSPIAVRVDELALERVAIAPGVIAPDAGIAFDATGAARDEGDEQALSLTLRRTDVTEGRIALSYLRDFSDGRLDLQLDAGEAAGGLVAALAGLPDESASLVQLNATGPLTDWKLAFAASVDGMFAAEGGATLNALEKIAARADFEVAPGPLLGPELRAALSPRATLDIDIVENDGGLIRVNAARLAAKDLSFTANGSVSRTDLAMDLAVALEARSGLSDLIEGVGFGRIGFEGAVAGTPENLSAEGGFALSSLTTESVDIGAAELAGRVSVEGERIAAALTGGASGLRLDRIEPETIGDATLRLDAEWDGAVARLATLEISAKPFTLSAGGEADTGANTAALTYALTAPDFAPIAAAYDQDAKGAIAAQGALDGALDAPRLKGTVSLTGLAFEGESYGQVSLSHDATFGDTPEGEASLRADGSRFGAVAFDGRFLLAQNLLSLNDLRATALGAEIEGAIDADLAASLASGEISLAAPDLSKIGEAIETPMRGAIAGTVALTASEGRQDAAFDIAANVLRGFGVSVASAKIAGRVAAATSDNPRFDIAYSADALDAGAAKVGSVKGEAKGDLRDLTARADLIRLNAEPFRAPAVTVEARVGNAASADPAIDVRIGAPGLNAPDLRLRLDEAAVAASGRLSALNISVGADGVVRRKRALSLKAAAQADLAGASQNITVEAFNLRYRKDEVALARPLKIAASGGVTRIDDLDLTLPGGGLTGAAALYGNGAAGTLRLALNDLTPTARIARVPVEAGSIEANATFDTRPGPANAKVTVDGRGVRFAEIVADVGALDIDADLDWDGRLATLAASVSGPFGDPLRARIAAPLRPSGGLVPTAPTNSALSGEVNWRGEIGELWALVPAPAHALAGDARIALTLGGTLDAPEIGGDVALSEGRYQNLDTGTILVDVEVASNVTPDGGFAVNLSADDGAGKPVTGLASLRDGVLDAKIASNGAVLVRRDDATAAVSLDVTAAGPLNDIAVKGRIGIDRAEIRLVDASPPGVADLGPVRILGEEQEEEETEESVVSLDLKIEAPRDVYIRGRGLDSEWMIDMTVTGTAAAPRITGAISKRRGSLSFLGRDLDLARGEIRFFSKPEPDPTLDILVQRENNGVTGGIAVTGTASAPEIGFTSQPALSEDEVLPRILFGRSSSALSPSEAVSLAIGLSTLLDGTGGFTDDLRAAAGLDVLRIEDGEDGPSVTVGSNIVDGVFVGAKQPVDGGSASVQVEIEIFDDFTIDSETGPDTGSSIGLNWKKDF